MSEQLPTFNPTQEAANRQMQERVDAWLDHNDPVNVLDNEMYLAGVNPDGSNRADLPVEHSKNGVTAEFNEEDVYKDMSYKELLKLSAEAEAHKDKTTMLSVDDVLGDKLEEYLEQFDNQPSEGDANPHYPKLTKEGDNRSQRDKMFDRVMAKREKYVKEAKKEIKAAKKAAKSEAEQDSSNEPKNKKNKAAKSVASAVPAGLRTRSGSTKDKSGVGVAEPDTSNIPVVYFKWKDGMGLDADDQTAGLNDEPVWADDGGATAAEQANPTRSVKEIIEDINSGDAFEDLGDFFKKGSIEDLKELAESAKRGREAIEEAYNKDTPISAGQQDLFDYYSKLEAGIARTISAREAVAAPAETTGRGVGDTPGANPVESLDPAVSPQEVLNHYFKGANNDAKIDAVIENLSAEDLVKAKSAFDSEIDRLSNKPDTTEQDLNRAKKYEEIKNEVEGEIQYRALEQQEQIDDPNEDFFEVNNKGLSNLASQLHESRHGAKSNKRREIKNRDELSSNLKKIYALKLSALGYGENDVEKISFDFQQVVGNATREKDFDFEQTLAEFEQNKDVKNQTPAEAQTGQENEPAEQEQHGEEAHEQGHEDGHDSHKSKSKLRRWGRRILAGSVGVAALGAGYATMYPGQADEDVDARQQRAQAIGDQFLADSTGNEDLPEDPSQLVVTDPSEQQTANSNDTTRDLFDTVMSAKPEDVEFGEYMQYKVDEYNEFHPDSVQVKAVVNGDNVSLVTLDGQPLPSDVSEQIQRQMFGG